MSKKEILNPVLQVLENMQAKGISKESICAASDIRFNTLRTAYHRNRVSERIRLKLKEVNLITKEDNDAYIQWEKEQARSKPAKRSKLP